MRVTRLSIIDWVCSKTQTLLTTLRIRSYLRVGTCVSFAFKHSSPWVGCADLDGKNPHMVFSACHTTPHTHHRPHHRHHMHSHTQHTTSHTTSHGDRERDTREREEDKEEERRKREQRRDPFVEKCLKPAKSPRRISSHCFEKKKTFGWIIRSEVQSLTRVFNYLHDSNSNFRPAGIYSEWVRDRIVWLFPGESRLFGCCEQVCTCRWVLLGATRGGAEKKRWRC